MCFHNLNVQIRSLTVYHTQTELIRALLRGSLTWKTRGTVKRHNSEVSEQIKKAARVYFVQQRE